MIERDLPFDDYCQLDGINQSSFSDLDPDRDGCPSIYYTRHEAEQPEDEDEDTEALSFGRAFHSYALTPEEFKKEYVIEGPELYASILDNARTEIEAAKAVVKDYRDSGTLVKDIPADLVRTSRAKVPEKFSKSLGAWKKYKEEAAARGKELLSPKQAQTIERMWLGALTDPMTAALHAEPDDTELTLQGELDDGTGNKLLCKARLDLLKGDEVHDLKTVQSASPVSVGRFIWRYRSYIQAAFYLDLARACGLEVSRFSWCFIDKRPPHPAVYHCAEKELIQLGRTGYQSFLQVIADCRERGHWPGHHDSPIYPGTLETLIEEVC